jgi:DNA (cytosine-5)-methyltransferase 1
MAVRSNRAQIRSNDLPANRGLPVRLNPLLDSAANAATWAKRVTDPLEMIVLDLFSGAGGMSHGFERAGFLVGAGLDNDAFACESFAANHLGPARRVDLASYEQHYNPHLLLNELGLPRVDVVIGGPPCQGFSQIGLAKVRSLNSDVRQRIYERNFLYREFVRFVKEIKPLMFVMENVPHLARFNNGLVAQQILEDFSEIGYDVYDPMILDASHYGVPQGRRRLFIVGTQIGRNFTKPRPTHGTVKRIRTLADAIADLPVVTAPSWEEELAYVARRRPDLENEGIWSPEYASLMREHVPQYQQHLVFDHIVRAVREDDAQIFRSMRPGGKYDEVDESLRRYELRANGSGGTHFADRYYRLRWDRPSITITAHLAKDGYRYIYPDNDQIRTLSIREAARIQSFPDHFRFAGYRTNRFIQVGNAVPPLLAEAIGQEVARAIQYYREEACDPRERMSAVQTQLQLASTG